MLGAVTHVDGTARLHTVSRAVNPRYYGLISAFDELTGVPVVLNTSFNNDVEPIVDSTQDALTAFLTTELDYLVVGNYLVRRRRTTLEDRQSMLVSLPPYVHVHRIRKIGDARRCTVTTEIRTSYDRRVHEHVSDDVGRALLDVEDGASLASIIAANRIPSACESAFVDEVFDLWARRLVLLHPSAAEEHPPRYGL
jgi:carbamoyltransferase